ncbi:MAG: InlB B-repeat-containing protein [Clostridia bacterium]|nr:InlB B-repeat-containing protein [Clostridia bacterium]
MKRRFWSKLLLCGLLMILAIVLMTSCKTPSKKEEPKPPKNVTFVVDGMEYDQLQTGDEMPEPPAKTGYDFAGWYDGDKKVDKIPASSDKDLTLTGRWTPTVYSITFEGTKDAVNDNAVNFTIESDTITLLPLEKVGYVFNGWYLNGVKIEQILSGTTGNLSLVAQWTPVTYDVVFEGVTGATNTNPDSFTVEDGKIQLVPPERPGYDFDGWYVGSELITEIDVTRAESITVRAEWTPIVFDIVFENTKDVANGNVLTFTVESGNVWLQDLELDGYVFLGWYNGTVRVDYIPAGTIGDVTLRAEWETVHYDIVFEDTKGANNPNDTYFTVEDDKVMLQPLEKEGYTFNGWYIGGVLVTEFDVDVLGTVTVTAKWTPHTYDIVFENTKGQPNSNYTQFTPDSDVIMLLPLDDKDGYRFVGWYAGNVRVESIPAGSVGDVTLRAEWEAIRYDVIYENTKGATNPNAAYFTVEDDKVMLLPLEKEGYVFDGWYINNLLVTEFTTDVLGNVTVTAKWTAKTYYITFENTKDAENGNRTEFTPDDTFDLLPLEKEGYNFLGWYLGEDQVTYISGMVGDVILEAQWETITYTITYEGLEDVDFDPLNATDYTVESGIVELYYPMKTGYNFDGWYLGGVRIEEIPEGSIGDLTVTARWSVITYTVTLENTKGATDKTELSYTLFKGVKLPKLTLEGYTFNGWRDENGDVITEIVVGATGDVTVTADWTPTVYGITYENVGEHTHSNPEIYTIEEAVVLEDLPDGDGVFFGGWYLDGVRIEEIPVGTTGDLVLTADWRIPVYTVEDLQNMGSLAGDYMLMNDLDLGGMEWTPLIFTGSFSGGGHTISNFKITTPGNANYAAHALFGTINGSICDLNVEGYEIVVPANSSRIWAGGIVAQMQNGTIVNCSATGRIEITSGSYSSNCYVYAGGIAGAYQGELIDRCYAECEIYVAACNYALVGGIAGGASPTTDGVLTVTNCNATVDATVDQYSEGYAGGIYGYNTSGNAVLSNCSASGKLDMAPAATYGRIAYVGGLVGINDAAVDIKNCTVAVDIDVWTYSYIYAGGAIGSASSNSTITGTTYTGTATVIGNNDSYYDTIFGGIAGTFNGKIADCTVEADIIMRNTGSSSSYGSGSANAGGILGYGREACIYDSEANVTITFEDSYPKYVGGIAGYAKEIDGCYANATISTEYGRGSAGGLAGVVGSVANSHATVDINVGMNAGGLVGSLGDQYTNGKMTNSYATGSVVGTAYVGGLAGTAYGSKILGCWADVTVEATVSGDYNTAYVGGLIGSANGTTQLDKCYAYADVTATGGARQVYAGGLVGYGGTVNDSYAIGSIYARSYSSSTYNNPAYVNAGGISGNGTVVSNCYASVDITGLKGSSSSSYNYVSIAYLVGGYYGSPKINNSYYNENAILQYGYKNDEVLTSGATTENSATPATLDSFKDRAWASENLWSFETDYWFFDGENYPTFNEDFIKNGWIEIHTAEDLIALSGKDLTLNYKLMADIDLGRAEWTPILSVGGIFDGNGHKISYIYMTSTKEANYGFIKTNTGTVRGLTIANGWMDAKSSEGVCTVGMIVGYNMGRIENCAVVDGSVHYYSNYKYGNYDCSVSIGGLVGRNDGVINGCYSTATVSSGISSTIHTYVGGLVGYNSNGTILNSYVTGDVSGNLSSSLEQGDAIVRVGGLVGSHEEGYIAYCYSTGSVYADGVSASAGGAIGTCVYNELDGEQVYACGRSVSAYSRYYTVAGALTYNAPSGLDESICSLSGMRVYSQKNSATGSTGTILSQEAILAAMAENFDPSVWSFSDSEYPTLSFFEN